MHHFTAAHHDDARRRRRTASAMLRDFREYRRSAVADGEKAAAREYLVPPGVRPVAHEGVRATNSPRRASTCVAPTSRQGRHAHAARRRLAVSAAQPSCRLLRNLLEPDVKMDETFLKEQERRRQKRLGDQIYDVTAWSLPLLYDVEVVPSATPITAKSVSLSAPEAGDCLRRPCRRRRSPTCCRGARAPRPPWPRRCAPGIRIHTGGEPFTIGPRKFDVGTAIVRVAENPPETLARLAAILARHAVEVVPLDSTWVDEGMSLGSLQSSRW